MSKDVELESNCYSGDTLGTGGRVEEALRSGFELTGDTLGTSGGVVEASRARVWSAWAKFKELFPIVVHPIV